MSDLLKKAKFPPYPPFVDVAEPPVSDADTQPPQIVGKNPVIGTLRTYLQSLHTLTEQQLLAHEAATATKAKNHPARHEPLESQIKRWWSNLPPCLKQRRFQIGEIAKNCDGRFKKNPALRDVAAALRALEWKECRDWTSAGRNRRFWIPSPST